MVYVNYTNLMVVESDELCRFPINSNSTLESGFQVEVDYRHLYTFEELDNLVGKRKLSFGQLAKQRVNMLWMFNFENETFWFLYFVTKSNRVESNQNNFRLVTDSNFFGYLLFTHSAYQEISVHDLDEIYHKIYNKSMFSVVLLIILFVKKNFFC